MGLEPISDGGEGVPSGSIIMWNGDPSDVPEGWTLCDGEEPGDYDGDKDVPDLRQRFVVGAGDGENPTDEEDADTIDVYEVGDEGGKQEHQLTEGEMPNHSHRQGVLAGTGRNSTPAAGFGQGSGSFTTSTAGNDEQHENRPPYYALAYIMKL